MDNNKELWKRAFTTDPRHVKPITGKDYGGNSPKPYWIIERLTDEFGPCGIGWGYTIDSERFERFSETDTLHVAKVTLWYMLGEKRGEVTQMGQTKASYVTSKNVFKVDEDAPKKSITDALVKCASYLGFAGDIFSGRWDDSKYVAEAAKEWRNREAGNAGGIISGPKLAYEELPEDWKAYVDDLARDVTNAFEQQGPAEAQALIDGRSLVDDLDPNHIAALYYKLDSKTRSALKATKKAA